MPEGSKKTLTTAEKTVFGCCTFLPLGFLMIIAPMISAGHGSRAFITTAIFETVIVAVIWLLNLSALADAFDHWRTDGLLFIPFLMLWLFPLAMGAILLFARASEENQRANVCRKCGYDLRESPVVCPECGTLVKQDPERF